jgi:mono/diheme cytochrome c family protein
MKRDLKSCMLYALFGLPIFLFLFIAVIYVANCGLSANCSQAGLPAIIHTPIPTLPPVSIPTQPAPVQVDTRSVCIVTGRDLLNSWVSAGSLETQPFIFRDITGNTCQATFANVFPLFNQANLWYAGALACDSCHNSDVTVAAAGLDLSSYAGILAGARRTSSTSQGEDILGGGNWESSVLNQQLFVYQLMPFGAPPGVLLPNGPILQAGILIVVPTGIPAETPAQEEVARPHTPGGPGEAISLTGDPTSGGKIFSDHCQICHGEAGTDNVVNPGSDDGTVPPLNPIDPTLVNSDYQTFAYNLDLFLQNGSVPEGPNAAFQMPAWGADGGLTQQQIADVIAYLISLNQ